MIRPAYSNWTLIRRLLLLASRYGWGCAWLMALQLASILFGLAGLTLVGLAIDAAAWFMKGARAPLNWPLGLSPPSGWSPTAVIAALAGGVLASAAIRALLNYDLSVSTSGLMQEQLVVEMRAQVYDKLQRLGSRYLGGHSAGSLIARVTSDVQAVRMFVDGVVLQLMVLGLTLAFHLTYMMCIDARLTLLCLATTPVVWLVSTLFCRVVRPAYDRNRELVDQMLLVLSENVRGVQVVKGFAQETVQMEKFQAANRAVKDQQRRIFWNISLYTPTTEFLLSLNTAILLGYGGSLVIDGRLSLGTGLIVFAGLLQQLSAQVSKMTNVINSMLQSLAGAQRVFQILDAPIEIRSPADAVRSAKIRGAIEFDRASFAYQPDHPVLDDVRLRIEPGQCVAVLGATGEGKTTLLHLIPRLLDVTAGGVRIDGVDVRRYDLDDLRRKIGIVYQEGFLFSDTVAANIAFGRSDAPLAEIRRAAELASADEFIRRLPDGYDTRLREGGKDLSGGQRQRVAIARALLQNPSILLLDDPAAAIDPSTEKEILQAMAQAMRGRTTLVVAHRVATLRRADLVIVLRGGRIAERGTHDALMACGGSYWRAARLQADDGTPADLTVVG